ncbi:MAG: hypothetical protein EAZ70_06730 [Runella slithyformis]|jgi:hypothetical protein|nr:MAG: hypothetical protein EAY79_04460 [Runella slithyformis]TAF27575.1 MAG: hypothetical protein EAZ70_06730 [Runella slithyformis]TAF49757.1 MAG: hypothetical protein EAZ63_00480 [Runella slithyformis]TAF79062.1 MAG: hypothetical protein EAZ50_12360 [Runella slithyformis]TAH10146.1 MAG: hypothetical protein EAZ14_08150 [Runella slithyformis]
MKSKNTPLRLVKDITVGASLGILLFGTGQTLQSCGSSQDNNQDYTAAEPEEKIPPFSRPVKTYISETSPGQFKITDEIPVTEASQAMAIIRYQNGKRDTLDPAGAKKLVMTDSTTKEYFRDANHYYGNNHHHSSLSSVLLWGGMGYMLGRNSGMRSYNADRERQYSSGVYANSATYSRSAAIHNDYHSHRTRVATRPSGGRTGFFSRSRSSGG